MSRFFIDRPIFATVLSIVITLTGTIALLYLHFRADPAGRRMARSALVAGTALVVVLATDWVHATAGWQGIQQRLVAGVLFVWLEVLAIALWRRARVEARPV